MLALLLVLSSSWIFARATPYAVDRIFRWLQFVSASLYSLGHGGNDAQKTMGIIAVLLFSQGMLRGRVPRAVLGGAGLPGRDGARARCSAAGASSTPWARASPGSRRCRASAPRPAARITLFLATWLGIPVSTTHTITGAIVGVGAARRASAVRWGIAGNIVIAWVITMPASALIGALAYTLVGLFA